VSEAAERHRGATDRRRLTGSETARSTPGLPTSLLRKASRRLQIICAILFVTLAFTWLGANWTEGQLAGEFSNPFQWVPGVTMMAASLVVFLLVRSARLSPAAVILAGLVFQVVVSFCIPISHMYGAYYGLEAQRLTSDLIGLSSVAVWILFFTVVFPSPPRQALVALALSGTAVPVTAALLIRYGDIPLLPAGQFVGLFVIPYVLVVAFAYMAARIIYGLGRDILHAEELGSYRLEELLGRGGMGEVWRARHGMLSRPAAVKVIRSDVLAREPGGIGVAIDRFEREAQATASLQSPHTVEVYDFGVSEDGSFYYAMELLDGIDLESLVRRFGPLPAERVVHVMEHACRSLEEAHRRGLIHRDLKPANLVLCQLAFEPDFLKVLDFGLVRHAAIESVDDPSAEALTKTGLLAGTPSYMAPEMAMGDRKVDGRADLYALACVAYKLLTGRLVFEEANLVATIFAHVHKEPAAPSTATELPVPTDLDGLLLACLSKDPADRPRSAEELAARLRAIELPRPWTRERADEWWRTHMSGAPTG
jgi:serine/threonine-protein kinase